MEYSKELNLDHWVGLKLGTLTPNTAWLPDAGSGFARLHARRAWHRRNEQRWIWAAAAAMIACFSFAAFPAPRVLAHRCIDCSVALWQGWATATPAKPISLNLELPARRRVAPHFSLPDATGKPISLADLRGEVVLLNFWATWCGGCQVEIPWFIELQNKFKAEGLSVVGISMDDDGWKSVRPYMKEKQVNYAIVIGDKEIGTLYGLDSMPMTLMIDREGKIAATHVGLVSKSQYRAEIEALLNQKLTAPASGQPH